MEYESDYCDLGNIDEQTCCMTDLEKSEDTLPNSLPDTSKHKTLYYFIDNDKKKSCNHVEYGLDEKSKIEVRHIMKSIAKKYGITCLKASCPIEGYLEFTLCNGVLNS